jgi:hypothetical protein
MLGGISMDSVKLKIQSETEDKYELFYLDGVTTWVHKSLIRDNHIPIIDNQVEVSEFLFQTFFASYLKDKVYEERIKESEKTFAYIERIPFLIENLDLIRKNKDYYHLYFDRFKIGHYVVFRPGLGGLLESYKLETRLTGTGSPFSGSGTLTAYCVGCDDFHSISVGTFSAYMGEFKQIQAFCPPRKNEEAKKQLRLELNF